jgi:hypothetical protein
MIDQQLTLLPEITITSRHLGLPKSCPLELWEECGRKIAICVDAGPFIIGDWLNEGTKRYGLSLSTFLKSDAASTMAGISSFSYDSLNSFMSVMDKIPKQYRIPGVSFAHHQTASKLALNQDATDNERKQAWIEIQGWLQIASDKKLSLREMALAINGRTKISDLKKNDLVIEKEKGSSLFEPTVSDIAMNLHRNCQPLVAQFEDEDDPIDTWTKNRKQAARLALEPLMDDLTKLTDYYIELCK